MMLPPVEAFSSKEHEAFSLTGGKPAALLVHGFPGTANDLRALAEVLNRDGWTTHNLLLPGFGKAIEALPKYRYKDWLGAVAAKLQELKKHHAPVLLIGHSMGGALSIVAAAQVGVDGLVLLAPFYKINHVLWSAVPVLQVFLPQFKPFKVFKPDFANPEFRDGVRKFMPSFDFDNPEHQQAVREFAVPVRIFAQVREAGVKAYGNAPKITAPSLVLQGMQDTLVVPENTRVLAKRLGGVSEYREIDGEHELNRPDLVSWEQVREAVSAFAVRLLKDKG